MDDVMRAGEESASDEPESGRPEVPHHWTAVRPDKRNEGPRA
jgi:hypothetical protein